MIVNTRPLSLSKNINLLAQDQMLDLKNIYLSRIEPNNNLLENQRWVSYLKEAELDGWSRSSEYHS